MRIIASYHESSPYVTKRCYCCNKTFTTQNIERWAYTKIHKERRRYFCSWSCLRKFEKKYTYAAEAKRKQIIDRQLKGFKE